ncbi:MAG: hypothetical protein HY039_11760 [Nitrospirae bacterium]|nr:hypothetical protein [Nitrospirota bacterium]
MIDMTVDFQGASDSDLRVYAAALSAGAGRFGRASVMDVLVSLAHAFDGELSRRETGAPGGIVRVPLVGVETLSEISRIALTGMFAGWQEQAVRESKPSLVMIWHGVLVALADARDAERARWKRIERDFRFPGAPPDDDEAGELVPPLGSESGGL